LLFCYSKWKRNLAVVILTIAVSGVCWAEDVGTESDPFPVYPCIQPNVSFWTQIYTQYSSDEGVIHDSRRLDIIYDVIELEDPYQGAGRKINQQRIRKTKKKFKAILAKLKQGKAPAGPLEEKVAALFGPNAKASDFRSAMYNIRCQVGQKDRFEEGLIRSGAYIEEIKQIFRDADLPEDLAYMPHVESSFNPEAYSKFGAAGMWQFTRSTGRRFMQIDYTIDERRDPLISSQAAAQLLRKNYQKLESWPLAITAYNHGATGMLRAKRKKGRYDKIFKEYRSRNFRFASRNFYSEFLAAREAAKNYRQYFGDLKLAPRFRRQEIELAGYVSLPQLARHLDIDLADLHELNPALRSPVFSGQKYAPGGYRLRLPDSDDRNWADLIAQLPLEIYRNKQKRSQIYTVRRGDTAGKIAKLHGVDLNDLIAFNNLDRRATIYVNQTLRIPLPEEKPILVARIEKTRKNSAGESEAPPPLTANLSEPPRVGTVQTPGDSAAEQKTARIEASDVQIAKAGMTETEARASADLPAETQNPASSPDNQFSEAAPSADKRQLNPEILQGHFAVERVSKWRGKLIGVIQVEAEETLGHYAEWLGVQARDIRRLNGFRYGQPLPLSRQIKIPLDRVSKEEFEEKRFEFHQELAEDFFATYRVEKVLTYSVKRGDSIWTLSRQEFEVPLWLLQRYNADVDFGALIPAQKLLIPVVEKNV